MYDIIIIGGGPAGLTASIYGRRANKKVLLIEAKTIGGQIINTLNIENYPGNYKINGFELATKILNQTKELGTEIANETVYDIKANDDYKEVITYDNTYKTKTVIIATGSDSRKLGLSNEDELIGKGISYCATCDGNFFRGKDVAVVGGGTTAIEDAIYLSDIVNKVYLIHRRDSFNVDDSLLNKLKEKSNIEYIYNSNVTKLIAQDKLNSIEITNKDGSTNTVDVEGLFVAIGRVPENQNYAKLLNLDNYGYIIADEDCHTNIDGIYVAGDARTKSLRQLVTATNDGAIAATEAVKYINK